MRCTCYSWSADLGLPTSTPPLLFLFFQRVQKLEAYIQQLTIKCLKISSKHSKLKDNVKIQIFGFSFRGEDQYTGNIGLTFPHDRSLEWGSGCSL